MNEQNGFDGDISRWDDEGGSAPVELTAELITDPVIGDIRDILTDMRDVLMLQTALLMRLYDVNMRLLSEVNEDVASALWDKHEKGGHENPPTMVPVFGETDDSTKT